MICENCKEHTDSEICRACGSWVYILESLRRYITLSLRNSL